MGMDAGTERIRKGEKLLDLVFHWVPAPLLRLKTRYQRNGDDDTPVGVVAHSRKNV
jgi:hypothetical protein